MSDAEFTSFIWEFYTKNRRSFPWRETSDPYAILVSELMLQQTQTHRVLPKFLAWMERFPTVEALANAPLSDVLEEWSGLGYNRRARFLWLSAKQLTINNSQLTVIKDNSLMDGPQNQSSSGDFPNTFEELRKLPGVGEYTANAVLAFAFNLPTIVVETNIRTVIIHHFFADSPSVSDKDIKLVLERLVPKDEARDWYYALMDYGNFLKTEGIDYFHKQKGYTKQKPFKGSERYVRGFLLREVLKKGKVKLSEVVLPGYTSEIIEKVGKDLAEEGLVKVGKRGTLTRI